MTEIVFIWTNSTHEQALWYIDGEYVLTVDAEGRYQLVYDFAMHGGVHSIYEYECKEGMRDKLTNDLDSCYPYIRLMKPIYT